jgi:RimJ/RimL family protein N-acetyltransferase
MYHIKSRNEALASKLIGASSHITYAGVVAGYNPGEVWVDQLENPSLALVWSDGLECFQFMGYEDNEDVIHTLAPFIEETLIPLLKRKGISFFEFAADLDEWYPIVYQALANKKLDESWQYGYKSVSKELVTYPVLIPQPFTAVSINEDFISSLNSRNLSNTDFMTNFITKYWGTVQNYLQNGYGYAALSQTKIASIALSTARYESTQELGVVTLEEYRKRGLSSPLVKMLLKTFNENGITPYWDCADDNIASQRTIEKIGLVRVSQYKVNWFYF